MIITRPSTILHVEDEDLFHLAVVEGLEDAQVSVNLHRAREGGEALHFLSNPAMPTLDLILLDLFMYPMGGVEFLRQRQSLGPCIQKVPIVILTTSTDARDQILAQNLGIEKNAFLEKPVQYDDLVSILAKLGHMIVSERQ